MAFKPRDNRPGDIVTIDGQPALIMYVGVDTKTVYYINLKMQLASPHEVGAVIPGYNGQKLAAEYEAVCWKKPKYSVGDKVICDGKTYRIKEVHGTAAFSDLSIRYTVATETDSDIYEDELDRGVDELATSATQQLASFQAKAISKVINENDNDCFTAE